MVLRDRVTILSKVTTPNKYGDEKIEFVPIKDIWCNVRIFFSQNEDGLQNRQGLSHLEGSLISRDAIPTKYFMYDGIVYHILVHNPQAKQKAYKFRQVK